ncbi:MAG: hypothetical protein E8D45_07825 [Nitrospira sp.]|nr:MAG: hypothetical protein E8D45_07825 [Nitrospira sp.]
MPASRLHLTEKLSGQADTHNNGGKDRIAQDFKRYGVHTVFNRLLTSWPLHPHAHLNEVGDTDLEPRVRSMWLEKKHGDGHYEDRAKLLRVAVEMLEDHESIDFPAVFIALAGARKAAAYSSLDRAKLLADRDHRLDKEVRLRRQLCAALATYRKHRQAWDPHNGALMQTISDLENSLPPLPAAQSRHRGRPADVDIPAVRHALTEAGVPSGLKNFRTRLNREGCEAAPKNLREALLMATCLIPYRTKRAP